MATTEAAQKTEAIAEEERAFELPNGMKIAATAYGNKGNPPVIFLHGGGQTRHAWGDSASAFAAAGWYAITMDHRGHGQSDWDADGRYELENFVEDLESVVEQVGSQPVLVGASLGGITALTAESKSEGRFAAALVLVDVTPRMERAGVLRIIDFMNARPDGFAYLEEVADAIAAYLPHRKRKRDLSSLQKNLRKCDDGRYRWHWDPKVLSVWDPKKYTPEIGKKMIAERLQSAANLTIPTLLVRGKMSDVVSEENAQEFLEHATHAEYVNLKDAGHMVAGDSNDGFTEAVIGFAQKHFGKASAQ